MYKIVYHGLVFKKLSKNDQKKILRNIRKKLSRNPEIFGKPLAGDLKEYYRLRIDQYRVIYDIKKNEVVVYILKIGLRKDLIAYIEAAKRLKLL